MLKINDSVEFSRTSAAVSLVLGALFFLAASLIEPAWAPDERAYLEEIAAASNRYQASGVLNALGSTATVFGMVGVLHLLRGRRVTLGQLGAGLVIMGSVLLAGHWLVVLIETAGAQVGPDQTLELLTTAQESPRAAPVAVGGLGQILGWVLIAVVCGHGGRPGCGCRSPCCCPRCSPSCLRTRHLPTHTGGERRARPLP